LSNRSASSLSLGMNLEPLRRGACAHAGASSHRPHESPIRIATVPEIHGKSASTGRLARRDRDMSITPSLLAIPAPGGAIRATDPLTYSGEPARFDKSGRAPILESGPAIVP